jgi:hypothetical protein
MCESRGQFGSSDKPRVVPWAQSVISKWTGFSRIEAAVLLPRRLLAVRCRYRIPDGLGKYDPLRKLELHCLGQGRLVDIGAHHGRKPL